MFDWIKNLKNKLIAKMIPSNLLEWLKGKKSLIGGISLALWFVAYGLPLFCANPICLTIGEYSIQLRQILESSGIPIDSALFDAGAGLTVYGLLDKISKYFITDKVIEGLKTVKL
jgi:hypothetical protein